MLTKLRETSRASDAQEAQNQIKQGNAILYCIAH